MKAMIFSPLLIIHFALLVSSATVPNPTTLIAPNAKNATILTSDFTCRSGRPPQYPIKPKQQDCALALRVFPSRPEIYNFHNAGAADLYQLPWFERYKTCEVLVGIDAGEGDVESSSWTEVGMAAMELIMGCTDTTGAFEGDRH